MERDDTLVERDQALDAVRQLAAGLGDGRGGALFVLAEAGLGKTSVLEYARDLAAGAGFETGIGRAHPMETAVPFGLATQALDEAGARGLLDEGRAGSAGADRAVRFYSVLRWLEDRPARPLLLALDDLHWADADSLALAVFITRRLAANPVALIGTARPWPGAAVDALLGLAHDRLAVVQRLAPLSAAGTAEVLAQSLGRSVPADVAQRAYALSAGNPLLLAQVAEALRNETDMPASGGLLLSRFAALPSQGMRCAQAAAVLGTRFQPAVAAEVAGLAGPDIDLALESLARSGLIEQGPAGDADFVHPLFRQALYDDLPGLVRLRLHARAFDILATRGQEARAAEHAIQANLIGDARAVAVLSQAGAAARRAGALETAVHRFDAAVTLAGDLAATGLLLARAEALLASGNPAGAVAAYQDLLATRTDLAASARVQANWMLGRAHLLTGAHDKADAALDGAVQSALPGDPATAVAVLLDRAFSTWLSTGPAHALTAAARAAELAGPSGEWVRLSAESAWALVALQTGDPAGLAAVDNVARDAWAGDARGMVLGASLHPLANFGFCAVLTERLPEAERAFAQVLAIAESENAVGDVALLSNVHAWVLTRMGRLDAALTEIDRAIGLADLVPVTEAYSWMARAYLQLLRGDLEDSDGWYARAQAAAVARGQWNSLIYLCDVRGMRCLRSGSVAQACESYDTLEQTMRKTGIGEPCLPPWARHGIAAYLAGGRIGDAERVIGWLEECAGRLPCRFPRIAALTGRAWLAELDGDRELAGSLFRQALVVHEETDLPVELAETLLGYGGFLRRGGELRRARDALARAARVAEASSAGWLASLALAELRVAGGRRRQATAGLTAQERRVTDLIVTGASNPETARQLHISVRTVESHLEHIYAKLGVRSRHELTARAAHQRPDLP